MNVQVDSNMRLALSRAISRVKGQTRMALASKTPQPTICRLLNTKCSVSGKTWAKLYPIIREELKTVVGHEPDEYAPDVLQAETSLKGLRRVRTTRGLSQAELAALSGVHQRLISAYESGVRMSCTKRTKQRLAGALNVSTEDLTTGIRALRFPRDKVVDAKFLAKPLHTFSTEIQTMVRLMCKFPDKQAKLLLAAKKAVGMTKARDNESYTV